MSDMRLIDADALDKAIKDVYCKGCNSYNGVRCRACWVDDASIAIVSAPTIDAVPVVHGRWEHGVTLGHEWRKCSNCLVSQSIFGCFTYCPNCGANMDGGAEDA